MKPAPTPALPDLDALQRLAEVAEDSSSDAIAFYRYMGPQMALAWIAATRALEARVARLTVMYDAALTDMAHDIARAEQAVADCALSPPVRACAWAADDDGIWHTACGHSWEFTTGGPRDNACKFCPYCGATLAVVTGWVCDTCGPSFTKVDEDGCCATCGLDARYIPDDEGDA